MRIKECKICGKEFSYQTERQIYCSKQCNDRAFYRKNKKKYIENARRWHEANLERSKEIKRKAQLKFRTENRERFNELMVNSFKRNRNKWYSRKRTRLIIDVYNKRKQVDIKKQCKICGKKQNLEIHHEIYPLSHDKIRSAINQGKIYYLCRKCHSYKKANI